MTQEPTYWYYDPEHRTGDIRQLPWGTADQCGMSAPFQAQDAAERARQDALKSLLNDLAVEAREINAANGWGLDFDPDSKRDEIPGYLALVHSEITEAWAAHSTLEANRELGDALVRILDLGQLIRPGCWVGWSHELLELGYPDLRDVTWAASLMHLHGLTSEALERYRKDSNWRDGVLKRLHLLLAHTWQVMTRYNPRQSPELTVREILAANRLRAYRHGDLRL